MVIGEVENLRRALENFAKLYGPACSFHGRIFVCCPDAFWPAYRIDEVAWETATESGACNLGGKRRQTARGARFATSIINVPQTGQRRVARSEAREVVESGKILV